MSHSSAGRSLRAVCGSRAIVWLAIATMSFLAACSDGPTPPTPPVEDPNSLEGQIRSLFTAGAATRDAALTQLTGIRQQIAAGATATARTRALHSWTSR